MYLTISQSRTRTRLPQLGARNKRVDSPISGDNRQGKLLLSRMTRPSVIPCTAVQRRARAYAFSLGDLSSHARSFYIALY